MLASLTSESVVTGKAKVLIIAEPELAESIYEALEPYGCFPARAVQTHKTSTQREAGTVASLFSEIFPTPPPPPPPTFLERMKTYLRKDSSPANPSAQASLTTTDSSMSLFQWGDYDFVIIQDLWPTEIAMGRSLECAGYVLANLDYYLWGNFATKKVILVTDQNFLSQKAHWETLGLAPSRRAVNEEEVLRGFDQKDAFERVDLHGEGADPVRILRQIITTGSGGKTDQTRDKKDVEGQEAIDSSPARFSAVVDAIMLPVMREAVQALRSYVSAHADVVLVDDEYDELKDTFWQITGQQLAEPPGHTGRVSVAKTSEGIAHQAKSFAELVELCGDESQTPDGGQKRYTLFVTDILFKGPAWHQTGLDLIEKLREQLNQLEETRRVGIVAYTSFTTPFIAMSSYQRGADFVVSKKARGAHDIKTEGTDRLLMTLAFLCFQKSFLLAKRREAGWLVNPPTSDKGVPKRFRDSGGLNQLRAVLPRHAVSLHLQQEWLDTCYIFEAINVYGATSENIKKIHKEVSRKYD
jgi:hypothetical protein